MKKRISGIAIGILIVLLPFVILSVIRANAQPIDQTNVQHRTIHKQYASINGDETGDINMIGDLVNFEMVRATRGKQVRAEPVSVIFTERRGHMAGYFIDLENELCGWVPGDSDSPNRLDAMVWGFTWLMITEKYTLAFGGR